MVAAADEPIGTIAVTLLGLASRRGVDILGCKLHMGSAVAPIVVWIRPVTSSRSSLSFPIPADPSLNGFQALLQSFYVPQAGKWSASNGVLLTLGE